MAIGPVQLLVLGFESPDFQGEVLEELERLRKTDTVRVVDALVVHKDAAGKVETRKFGNMTIDEKIELGSVVGALVGLGAGSDEAIEKGAELGAEAGAAGLAIFNEEEALDAIAEIPPDTAAALILLEHHWAVPLRDAVYRAGGFPVTDRWISPLDLVALGMYQAEEVRA